MAVLNIEPRTVFCRDNLDVLHGMNSACIDLIYLDPPFNKKKTFAAPLGSSAEGAAFSDIFRQEDVKDEWLLTIKEDQPALHVFLEAVKGIEGRTSYNFCYLAYMAIRLIELHRVLKDTGSLYLHCDPTMSHYLKILLDIIFGEAGFRNEIVWYYKNASRGKRINAKSHDIILWYSKSSAWVYNREQILQAFESGMTEWRHRSGGQQGKSMPQGKTPDDVIVLPALNAMAKERSGYPTQKPLALLDRIIVASSNVGDVVLDPFCGGATTMVSAERLQRQWIGIDVSHKAYELVTERLQDTLDEVALLANPQEASGKTRWGDVISFSTSPPKRTDVGADHRLAKFVYVISNPQYPDEYKVGIASEPKRRLNQYQTSDPERQYKLEHQRKTVFFRELEAHIHATFPNKHEWVSGELSAVIAAIDAYEV